MLDLLTLMHLSPMHSDFSSIMPVYAHAPCVDVQGLQRHVWHWEEEEVTLRDGLVASRT